MKRLACAMAFSAAALLLFAADPALADVASTLQTAGTNIITWVRAGAILVVIGCGIAMVRGWFGAWAFAPALIGLAVAISPEQIVGWIS